MQRLTTAQDVGRSMRGMGSSSAFSLYRAMDFLEANRTELEKEVLFRVSDLFSLEVDLIFYDTTSLHFEIDEEDEGFGPQNTVRGSQQASSKTYPALRQRGYAKSGRGDASQIVVGLAVTRDGLPVRHWIFPVTRSM